MEHFRRYPAGVQDFEAIRQEGFVYIDKTEYIYNLANKYGNAIFLSRPRRFGKSLLCSTLKYYFQGRHDLFEGLAIDRLETNWPHHPVLHFSMSSVKSKSPEVVRQSIVEMLSDNEQLYGIDYTPGLEPGLGKRLSNIIRRAHASSGQKTVVIIDEYDAPVLHVIGDSVKMDAIRDTFNELYPPLKDDAEHLRFVFITGITKFSQMSIFSSINNLTNVSLDENMEALCGITSDELEHNLQPDVTTLAQRCGLPVNQMWAELREHYDGYHFSRALTDIYNPYSLLCAFQMGDIIDKWFESATPSALIDLLRHYPFDLGNLDNAEFSPREFDLPFDDFTTAIPILFQSGYLTIKGYDRPSRTYTLGIPNREVHNGLYLTMVQNYLNPNPSANMSMVRQVARAIHSNDIDGALRSVQDYLSSLPYDLRSSIELGYERDLRIIFECVGIAVDTEVKNAIGRCDVILKTPQRIYVIELKTDRGGTVDDALAQIESRNYLLPYRDDPREKVKVGVVIDHNRRTLGEWKIKLS